MSEAAAAAGFSRLLSDDRLTQRAVGGDQRAFAAIFRRYHQGLFRFCLAIVGNPEDAQDALQNTMMKVLRALPGEERKIELKPWLYRIAHNESIDLLRRRRETRELDVEQVAPGYGLTEDVAARERLRRLLADLRELPERQREVLVMRELAGLDFDEIGTALETSGAVARQTLYEARQSLRQMEEGREMSCEEVTRALSDGDGRVTRRRDIRAHLRSCAGCRHFREDIESRQRDLAALSPLPAVVAAGMLQGLLGGAQGVAGTSLAATIGGGAAKTIGASAAAKGAATAAVVAAIGVTAADQSGVIHLGLPGEEAARPGTSAPAVPGSGQGSSGGSTQTGTGAGDGAGTTGKKGAGGSDKAQGAATKGQPRGKHGGGRTGNSAHPPQGPQGAHPRGRGHEKQHPEAATRGQETAGAHRSPSSAAAGGGGGGQAVTPSEASRSTPAAPASPSSPAPSSPPAAPPQPQAQVGETPAPAASQGAGAINKKIP